jgi:outer membrane receptor protein involved in Fe transport
MRLFGGLSYLAAPFSLIIPKLRSGALSRAVVTLFVAFAALSVPVFAQVETGQIAGTVTDASGAVVPAAVVTVKSLASNLERSAQSSNLGSYVVIGLQPGTYSVSVSANGFRAYSATAEVTVGGHVTVDAKLSVSSDVTNVEVVAEGGSQVNTQTQELSQIIDSEQVQQLPSLTRNPYDFVAISGNISNGDAGSSGSSSNGSNSQNSNTRGVGFNINGQRSSGTEILLDGVENLAAFTDSIGTQIPLDAMQEYRVSTSNFDAQFGRASGGVVNVTTKGGTNNFHGNAWEYNRLSAYTSNTETNDQEGIRKGVYTRNQFGFAVGGPIKTDKLFFFGSSEWTRVRSSANLTAGVPTPGFLAAAAPNVSSFFQNFGSENLKFIQTYTASQVYGVDGNNNSLVPSGLSSNIPMMGVVAFTAPQNAGGGLPQNTYNFIVRGDYNLSDRTTMYGRMVDYHESDQSGSVFASPYAQYNVGQEISNQAYLYSVSHVFTPALSSSTKLSFSRFYNAQTYDTSLQSAPTMYIAGTAAYVPGTNAQVQLPGFFDVSSGTGGLPSGGPENTAQINHDMNWQKGKHSIQSGVQLIYIQENQGYGAYGQAVEQLGENQTDGFQALYTGSLYQFDVAVDPQGTLPCAQDPYTGQLINPSGCQIQLPASAPNYSRSDRFKDWSAYAQDSYKITNKLNLNYGVRYEYYGVQHNNNSNLDSNFYYGAGASTAEQIRSGQVYTVANSPIHKLWNPTYGAVSPRVGFAYDVFGNGRDSIRGGYGIAYERNFGNVTFNIIQNPPNYAVIQLSNTAQNPLYVTSSNLGPMAGSGGSEPLPPTSLRQMDQNIKTAQTQFWSLAIEHQINHTTMVSVEYVGARGIHLYDIKNYNGLGSGNALLGDSYTDPQGRINPATGQVYQALTTLNPQYASIFTRGSGADSYYHGANVQFQTTNLHQTGLSVVANYTLAHSIDDLSTTFSETNNTMNVGYTDPFNPRLDRGNSDLDVRQRVVVAPIYEEPYFKNAGTLTRATLASWEISGIFQAHTGSPFTYFDSTSNMTGYNIPRYTPSSPVTQRTFKSIPQGASGGASNAYVLGELPLPNSWGNPNLGGASDWGPWPASMAGRNSFRGPGMWNVDAAVSKIIPLHDRYKLEFRAEGFNILNHHNLYLLESKFDAFNFGDGGANPQIIAAKGGVGNNGGANDERRFGQFSLELNF